MDLSCLFRHHVINHYQGSQTCHVAQQPSVLADAVVFKSPGPGQDSVAQKWSLGAGEPAQSGKCLPYKNEGLCWIPRMHSLKRKSGTVGHTGNPSTEERKRKPCGSLASPAESESSRFSERPISEIKVKDTLNGI